MPLYLSVLRAEFCFLLITDNFLTPVLFVMTYTVCSITQFVFLFAYLMKVAYVMSVELCSETVKRFIL